MAGHQGPSAGSPLPHSWRFCQQKAGCLAFATSFCSLRTARQAGRLDLKESSLVGNGLIPARMCVRIGLLLIALALAGTGIAWGVWGQTLAGVTLGSSLVWILAPSWLVHIATSGAGKWRTE